MSLRPPQPLPLEYRRDQFLVSTDPRLLQLDVIHRFLAEEAYWSPGVSRERVDRSIQNALCYGLYEVGERITQAGFARIITDYTTFAYIADVFVRRPFRGRGLGVWLIECLLQHPDLQALRKWTLDTRDAQGLYARFGFQPDPHPERHMVFRPASPRLQHDSG